MSKSLFMTLKYLYIDKKRRNYMKILNEKKNKISIALNQEIIKLLDNKTSNRSNYIDCMLLDYFNKIGENTSKIKL